MLALAAAGVGTLTVIDDDVVELSNLQRQVLHRLADVDAPKVTARCASRDLAPETTVRPVRERLTAANAEALLSEADLVIDGSTRSRPARWWLRPASGSGCRWCGVSCRSSRLR